MKIYLKKLIISIAIPLAAGGLSALLTRDAMRHFSEVNKPPLSPAPALFPIVWTVLYILMGVASYLVTVSDVSDYKKRRARLVYGVSLFFNFLWPLVFFNTGAYLFAFIWLLALLALVILTAVSFYRADKRTLWLLLPYILWLVFAAYLNFGVYLLK